MLSREYVLAPQVLHVDFQVAPVFNALESLSLLADHEELSGLGEWVERTVRTSSPDLLRQNELLLTTPYPFALFSLVRDLDTEFPDFLRMLEEIDAVEMRERALRQMIETAHHYPEMWPPEKPIPTVDQLLSNRALYTEFATAMSGGCDDPTLIDAGFDLIVDAERMKRTLIQHLWTMWRDALEPEWQRTKNMLYESAAAFSKNDYSRMTGLEVIRAVTGRDMTGKIESKLEKAARITFVPSAHIGPYIGKLLLGDTLYIMFGARLPRGAQSPSSDLSRAELLIRLNALADDTRLRILEMLTREEELCAQDIIERLDLSQPTVSRHLSQLSATGYITERRKDVAKCYSLNTERVFDTLRALTNFLSRQ